LTRTRKSPVSAHRLALAAAELARAAFLAAALVALFLPRAGVALKVAGLAVAVVVWAGGGSASRPAVRELARYVAGFVAFAALRNLADDAAAGLHLPVRYDYVIRWERALVAWVPGGIAGGIPTTALQHAFLTPGRWGPLDYGTVLVYLSYFLVPPAAVVILWRWWPDQLRRYVTATLALFTVAGIANLLVPTAPPWYAALYGKLAGVVQLGRAVVGEVSSPTYRYGAGLSGNAVAAMPSVHLGVTALIVCALWSTPLRWPALGYLLAMGFAVVYGGEHYAVDVLAGVAIAVVAWRWAQRPAVDGAPLHPSQNRTDVIIGESA
jgi:membrane-associated phospholipid phosphatase